MNGLVYFLERQFSREDIMHWRRKSFNPGILLRMMARGGYERGHLVPRGFQLDRVFATSALQDITPPVYERLCKTHSS